MVEEAGSSGGVVHLLVAHMGEARPLLSDLGLRRVREDGPFARFEGEGVHLVVAGQGKANAGAGVAYLHARSGGIRHAAWLNVGIAGHARFDLGSVRLGHKIVDVAAGHAIYPPLVFARPCASTVVFTVDRVEGGYPEDGVYDMEASAFCQVATRFCTSELVQVIKIVADNRLHPALRMTAGECTQRMAPAIEVVAAVIHDLRKLSAVLRRGHADPAGWVDLTSRWSFSTTQKLQLRRLLQHWSALLPCEDPSKYLGSARGAKAAMSALRGRLDAARLESSVVHD
ncbi:MAG: hypothetical protein V3V08_16460 [Nannocystaceae bacterium]